MRTRSVVIHISSLPIPVPDFSPLYILGEVHPSRQCVPVLPCLAHCMHSVRPMLPNLADHLGGATATAPTTRPAVAFRVVESAPGGAHTLRWWQWQGQWRWRWRWRWWQRPLLPLCPPSQRLPPLAYQGGAPAQFEASVLYRLHVWGVLHYQRHAKEVVVIQFAFGLAVRCSSSSSSNDTHTHTHTHARTHARTHAPTHTHPNRETVRNMHKYTINSPTQTASTWSPFLYRAAHFQGMREENGTAFSPSLSENVCV